ncbi:hypothetical protein AM592_00185 [Bacillus gobiensis]|uniref:Uncharacterized protein n=1 Tax=Bacillus gobiensis TaxID=1441095 RepID=A0A0M4FGX3_9BACI|nr:hypothetical protein AM592_00185 [Bacillus gobiensis]
MNRFDFLIMNIFFYPQKSRAKEFQDTIKSFLDFNIDEDFSNLLEINELPSESESIIREVFSQVNYSITDS